MNRRGFLALGAAAVVAPRALAAVPAQRACTVVSMSAPRLIVRNLPIGWTCVVTGVVASGGTIRIEGQRCAGGEWVEIRPSRSITG